MSNSWHEQAKTLRSCLSDWSSNEVEVKDLNLPVLRILPSHGDDSGSLNVSNADLSDRQMRGTGRHDYTCLNQFAESCTGLQKYLFWLHFSQGIWRVE